LLELRVKQKIYLNLVMSDLSQWVGVGWFIESMVPDGATFGRRNLNVICVKQAQKLKGERAWNVESSSGILVGIGREKQFGLIQSH
jgi:hypothetical protein